MGESTDRNTTRAAELIDELVVGHRALAKAQARCAALMMDFAETRSACDRRVIADREAAGVQARYKAGEFAGTEISMALRESKYSVQNTMVIARRLRADTPEAWDAWQAGDITHDKAERISRTLGKLVRANSKALLNAVVVDVAVCKTGELLGRWLNQFVARVEPDEQDERIHRSLADRYVSVRPDLDGVSFLSAALSSLDAAVVDRVLTAIAAVADPSDTRTLRQRRADALVDVLLGRISNGCHTRWDGADGSGFEDNGFEDNSFEDNSFDDNSVGDAARNGAVDDGWGDGDVGADGCVNESDQEPTPADPDTDADDADAVGDDSNAPDLHLDDRYPDAPDLHLDDRYPDAPDLEGCADVVADDAGSVVTDAEGGASGGVFADGSDLGSSGDDTDPHAGPDAVTGGVATREVYAVADPDGDVDADADADPDVDAHADADPDAAALDDWDLPASAFRPDPPRSGRPLIGPTPGTAPRGNGGSGAATGVHPCTCGGRIASQPAAGVQIRPVQVNIGIIISAASLFGFTNTPGQLADRSALIPADTIRDLAGRPGTLFHRLVTDTGGNLLQVTELGRFPSKKLALAVTYRDGVCNPDTCYVSAARGDLDHVIPVPEGPTTASNLKARCRKDHRAKTHAGHQTERTGPHTTKWTTPTGHTYESTDDPLPVEEFPSDPP